MRIERVNVIENPCRLSVDTARLRIDRDGAVSFVAVIDLAVLLIDTAQVELTASVLRELSQADVLVIVTDAKHYPSAVMMPSTAHTHTVRRQRLQATQSKAFSDRMWANTIAAKLRNQARFLSAQDARQSLARLERMASTIAPGDPQNFEAQGAKLYWKDLFKDSFKRTKQDAPDTRNAALNFGYAILRGLLARYLCMAGLSPIFGFGHVNLENPYCLVDDLIEPFRPCVDAHVVTRVDAASPFDSTAKRVMLKLLDCEALMGSPEFPKRHRLHAAVHATVASYVRALENHREDDIEFPWAFVLPLA